MSPAKTAAAPPRTIDAAAYGFVPAADVNGEYAGPSPDRDALLRFVATGDWPAIENLIASMDRRSDRRFDAITALGKAAVVEDGWLNAWLAGAPNSIDAWCVQISSMIAVAWEIRSSAQPQQVARDQWDGFFRLLRQIPAIYQRLIAQAPDDPAPHIEMLTAARGLQWDNDKFRALWSATVALAPQSVVASQRAMNYWRPRWFGSKDLLAAFVDAELDRAALGSTVSILRLDLLYTELEPSGAGERQAFYQGDDLRSAIDLALADLAAADPNHVRLPHLRHWLAYLLYRAGRNYEAIEQFRAVGGYSGAAPWTLFAKSKAEFTAVRATAVVRWEDAGRPLG